MAGPEISVEGGLAYFLMPILPNIDGEPTRERLIDLHLLISGNAVSVASNLGGGQHGHLGLTMIAQAYTEHTGYKFVPPHNPLNYPPMMGTSQEQELITKSFLQNQVLFRRYTAVDGALKIILSWWCNQSYYPHWWNSRQILDRFLLLI